MGASFLLTRHVPSLLCCCRQTVSKPCLSAPWGETKRGATGPAPYELGVCEEDFFSTQERGSRAIPAATDAFRRQVGRRVAALGISIRATLAITPGWSATLPLSD